MSTIIFTLVCLGLIIWLIIIYNRLVSLKNQVEAAWSDISVQLKRRHDLIPKLVEVVKQYASYEQALLTQVTEIRTQSQKLDDLKALDLNETGLLEQNITEQLGKIKILAEDYPDLKASQHFIELQKELSIIEETLQHARRFYNGAVRMLNTRIDTFPDLAIARLFSFKYRQYFQMDMN
ncbi:MAG: LemA family protein [Gammaproteobacteria bacterium]|nr:LemA family protein [Gammaproteobacteria bacterium]